MKKRLFISLVLLLFFAGSFSQLPYGLVDGREDGRCDRCINLIQSKPPEVLFGIFIQQNGDVYFSMDNKEWFDKIFSTDSYGISADIVPKSRYDCKTDVGSTTIDPLRGHLLQPVYRPQFKQNMKESSQGAIYIKIGKLPRELMNKELEGNLVIINERHICYYTNFVNIDRNVWDLLPMGLYSDSLISSSLTSGDKRADFFTYEKKLQITVPFAKNRTEYNSNDIQPLYDSLELKDYRIKKIEIRAYSSVEGPERINFQLMKGRADAMVNALKKFQPSMNRVQIRTAENWLEFLNDVKATQHGDYAGLPKEEIKRKLLDKAISEELEPVLSRHRKAIVTVYVERKTAAAALPGNSILSVFKSAVDEKDIPKARIILKELADRIADNKLPSDYIDRLEVPMQKDFWAVLNDREIYRYLLLQTGEYEALENFRAIQKIDPLNGRINYNICALQFFIWKNYGDTLDKKKFLADINNLGGQGIASSLVKRMQINYNILMCMEYMRVFNYKAKDESLIFIRNNYVDLQLNDEDRYSLAKYFTYYAHHDWAEEIVAPRIDQLDVSENLVFYYVNLGFYHPERYTTPPFQKAVINAININKQRFCNFFLPTDKGGASMQLLEYDELWNWYCESCTLKKPISSYQVALNR